MFTSFSDAKEYITKDKVEVLDLKYIDLNGRWRHVTIPPSAFSPALLEEGVGFDGSSIGRTSWLRTLPRWRGLSSSRNISIHKGE